jgi:hypothetical protein
MITDSFYEIRLEAAKMLCDLIPQTTNNKSVLQLPECIEFVTKAIEGGLKDDFQEIQQFTVIAFALFATMENYRSAFLQSKTILHQIIPLIRNVSEKSHFYSCAQMRRQAAHGLLLIVRGLSEMNNDQGKIQKKVFLEMMEENDFENKESWEVHAKTLIDSRTRSYSLEVSNYF